MPEFKIDCNCRKPKPGLLNNAARDLNADLAASWMIGDSTADILAAERAGVRSVLVRTGEGGRDGKYPAVPDFVVADITEAVALITETYPKLADWAKPIINDIRPGDLVLIGGLARSGKSTLAAVLEGELRGRRMLVKKLSMDRWIFPGQTMDLASSVDLLWTSCRTFLTGWLAGEGLDATAPFYDRLRRRRVDGERIRLNPDGVLILEGVPALLLDVATERRSIRLFMQTAESGRARRVIDDLRDRGADRTAANEIYEQRFFDEVPPVVQSAEAAKVRLSLDDLLDRNS